MMPRPRSLLRVAGFFVALSFPLAAPLFATDARASVSLAATWDGLLHQSTAAAVVTAMEARPVWENGRIYTYTHVRIDRPVAGALGTSSDAWVRTMGGIVGKVGQAVEGEAAFVPGQSSLLFLRPGPSGAFIVTSRGQGQFPIAADDPTVPARIAENHSVGMLVHPRALSTAATPPRLAAEVLHGRPVDDAVKEIAAAWGAAHAQ
jgi:hypothetical protein